MIILCRPRVLLKSRANIEVIKSKTPGVAAGRSAPRRHQFLEAHQVQHPFEVVSQGRQAPLTLNLGQAFEQKVRVAEPRLDRPERILSQCLS